MRGSGIAAQLCRGERPQGHEIRCQGHEDLLAEYTPGQWKSIALRNDERMADVEALKKQMDDSIGALQARFESKVEKLQRGDETCRPAS